MKAATKKWIKTAVRWGIAVAGIWYIVSNISLYNRVIVINPNTGRPVPVKILTQSAESDAQFTVEDPTDSAKQLIVQRNELIAKSELDKAVIKTETIAAQPVEVLGLKVIPEEPQSKWPLVVGQPRNIVQRFLGKNHGDRARFIPTDQVVGGYSVRVPYPLVERGLAGMTVEAFNRHPTYLLLAIFVFPVVFFITAFRWIALMKALDISMTFGRAFVINMVGAFYNSFLPGSTGGDLLRMHYAGKQTQHRTRAWLSVIIDRVIGLLALVILGGTMATYQYFTSNEHDDATHKCGQIALGSAVILGGALISALVFYVPALRRLSGLDFFVRKLPKQDKIQKIVTALECFRGRWALVLWALLITIPVHATVVVSATFAGKAFEIPFQSDWYYWVVVPVVVLAGAIPISPQGAGVMEFFAWLLMRRQGCTMGHVLALTMSIRLVQILWNLTGVVFVLKGGFHAPTASEASEIESDTPAPVVGK